MKRQTTDKGVGLIKRSEGFRNKVYPDSAGKQTIGYGHLLKNGESFEEGITEAEAEFILKKDIKVAEDAVNNFTKVNLSDGQFDALVSFTFNVGSKAFQDSTLLKKINKGEFLEASSEFSRWVYAGGTKLRGLELRREEEARLFLR